MKNSRFVCTNHVGMVKAIAIHNALKGVQFNSVTLPNEKCDVRAAKWDVSPYFY